MDAVPVDCFKHARYVVTMKLTVTTRDAQEADDRRYWRSCTPEERLNILEELRIEAGKFIYEYPSRLRRTVTISRRARS